ncbi:hypothetical protein GSI_12312 [Ganoderma sinense ZZ0214-1]|uniref:MULE transposase domain-containing protein n=1 Tax=Ganoderma sinense ZZ0214-1 TaxID=1077348 RepID=A0A2G8RYI9_9APHY|nr:hypothetical protein GSI_12312 [Ganoderma sinense ZZ0214-1]
MSSTGDTPLSIALPTDSAEVGTQKCSGCARTRPVTDFPFKKKGAGAHDARTKTCEDCTIRKQAWRTKERAEEADGGKKQPLGGNKQKARSDALDQVPLTSFLRFLEENGKVCDIEALVLASDIPGDRRKRADALAELIWKRLELRFIYHSKHELSTSNQSETTFTYNCAQNAKRQKKSKKVADPKKHRDKDAMDSFDCHGWLSIRVTDNLDIVAITLTHRLSHVPYCPIDLPDDVVAMINENPNQTVSQLWTEILKTHPKPAFSRATVYARWAQNDRKLWKRHDDEFQSASALLQEALGLPEGPAVEPIDLPDEDGFTGLAFALPQLLGQWGGRIRELALDSTFNTNGSRFELYALLGEVYGSGLPLAYLLLRSDNGEKGGKARYLTRFLTAIRDHWHLNPLFTLTDKDWSEINACRAVFPWAKHQLCYWHALRAIKTRLAILRRMPAYYHAEEAHTEFSWISEDFVPRQQQTNPAIPTVRLRFNGELVSLRPEMPPQSTLIIDAVNDPEAEAMQLEADELPVRVEQELEKDEQDAEDGPDWMFEDGEERSSDPEYVFCPAAHRKQILRLVTKHFCLHPLFPEQDSNDRPHTSESIRHDSVYEMYNFCRVRGLAEVWGYLWTSWYAPQKWKLWARSSSSDRISRLRTTMTVEKHWQQLKGDHLHHLVRPRLDQLTFILINRVTPGYVARAEILEDTYRLGRAKPLTTYQRYFKAAWNKLQKAAVSGWTYITDVAAWTCNCGQQKYHPQHLCKHLVQAVPDPSLRFFQEVYRRRAVPIYRHRELRPRSQKDTDEYLEADEGTVTDGDDHVWLGDRSILQKRAGWEVFEGGMSERKRRRTATPAVSDHGHRSSSPLPYAEEDSEKENEDKELDQKTDKLKRRVKELRQAADLIEAQLPFKNKIWIGSMVDRNIGGDVSLFLGDVRHFQKTASTRSTTWAKKGDREGQRRSRNTMGYQLSSDGAPQAASGSGHRQDSPITVDSD